MNKNAETTTWRKEISKEMRRRRDRWADLVAKTISDADLDKEFDAGFFGRSGAGSIPFTLWTTKRVYFPVTYDGGVWAESVARHPDGKRTMHVGGG